MAFDGGNCTDNASARRSQSMLDLHGLHDHQRLALGYPVTWPDVNCDDAAGQGRSDRAT